jgi:hypothetical protein
MDVIPSNIILQAAAAATFVKVLIDILKMATDPPRWAPPALAVSGGIGIILLLMVAGEVELTRAAIANAILAGIMAGGTAVGVTELSKRANPNLVIRGRGKPSRMRPPEPPGSLPLPDDVGDPSEWGINRERSGR